MKVISARTMARLLLDRLADGGDPSRAVTLARLLGDHLAYSEVRSALDLAGKGEYDVAVLGLLVDRSLLQVDPAIEAAARSELENPEPGLSFVDALSDRLLRLRSAESIDGGEESRRPLEEEPPVEAPPAEPEPPAEAPPPAEPEEAPPAEAPPAEPEPPVEAPPEPEPPATAPAAEPASEPEAPPAEPSDAETAPAEAPVACWSCDATLPERDDVRFCPNCGVDQRSRRCPACGDRLETGWSFCPRCGRAVGS